MSTFHRNPIFDEVVLTMPPDANELDRLYGPYRAGLKSLGRPGAIPRWSASVTTSAAGEPIEGIVLDPPARPGLVGGR